MGLLMCLSFFSSSKFLSTIQLTPQGFLKVRNLTDLKNGITEWLKEIGFEVERMLNVLFRNDTVC